MAALARTIATYVVPEIHVRAALHQHACDVVLAEAGRVEQRRVLALNTNRDSTEDRDLWSAADDNDAKCRGKTC
jgi:hypothetical protein